jgi:hypothetical protein
MAACNHDFTGYGEGFVLTCASCGGRFIKHHDVVRPEADVLADRRHEARPRWKPDNVLSVNPREARQLLAAKLARRNAHGSWQIGHWLPGGSIAWRPASEESAAMLEERHRLGAPPALVKLPRPPE